MNAPLPIFPPHSRLPEPDLLFHPDRKEDRSPHPLLGLIEFGPYSRSTVHTVLDPIRVAVITPHGGLPDLDRLFNEFSQRHWPRERKNYLPEYQGFSRIFGVNIVRADAVFEFPPEFDEQIQNSPTPYVVLAESMARALSVIETKRNQFDVVAVYLPNRWERGFFGPEGDDFDLQIYAVSGSVFASFHGTPPTFV